jgi:hypothetical protein
MRTLVKGATASLAACALASLAPAWDRILVAGYGSNNMLSFYVHSFEFEGLVLGPTTGGAAVYAAMLHQGKLYTCNWGENAVHQFDVVTGAYLQTISSPGSEGAADMPAGLAIGADGMLVVSSSQENVLRRFHPHTGEPLGIFVGVEAGLSQPDAIIRTSTGHFLVCSRGNHAIFRISADGKEVERLIWDDPEIPGDPTGGLRYPQGLLEWGDTLLVSSGGTHALHKYRMSDGEYLGRLVNTGGGGLRDPRALALLPSGDIMVASNYTDTIKMYTPTGAYISAFGQNAPYPFIGPTAIVLHMEEEVVFAPGDTNCDGVVSVGDVGPFVLALTDPSTYATAYPECDLLTADCNGDGVVSVGDIGSFVTLVTGG